MCVCVFESIYMQREKPYNIKCKELEMYFP